MAVGLGMLALAPAQFWAMTPRELAAAVHGRMVRALAAPLSRESLETMMTRFPDQ